MVGLGLCLLKGNRAHWTLCVSVLPPTNPYAYLYSAQATCTGILLVCRAAASPAARCLCRLQRGKGRGEGKTWKRGASGERGQEINCEKVKDFISAGTELVLYL